MQLSGVERWILSNQLRILEALYPDDAGSLAEQRTSLERGETRRDIHSSPEWVPSLLESRQPQQLSLPHHSGSPPTIH
jgi:hypothetical protein